MWNIWVQLPQMDHCYAGIFSHSVDTRYLLCLAMSILSFCYLIEEQLDSPSVFTSLGA